MPLPTIQANFDDYATHAFKKTGCGGSPPRLKLPIKILTPNTESKTKSIVVRQRLHERQVIATKKVLPPSTRIQKMALSQRTLAPLITERKRRHPQA